MKFNNQMLEDQCRFIRRGHMADWYECQTSSGWTYKLMIERPDDQEERDNDQS